MVPDLGLWAIQELNGPAAKTARGLGGGPLKV